MKLRKDYDDDTELLQNPVAPSLREFNSDVEFFKTTMVYEIRNRLGESYCHPTSLGSIVSLFREKYKKLRYLSDEQRELTRSWVANAAAEIDEEA